MGQPTILKWLTLPNFAFDAVSLFGDWMSTKPMRCDAAAAAAAAASRA